MTLDQIKVIAAARTKGEWHIGHIDEALDRGEVESDGIIIASDCRRNDELFICMAAANIDKLVAVAEAAKAIHICNGDFQDEDGSLRKALAALEQGE